MTGLGMTLGSLELELVDSWWWLVVLTVSAVLYGSLAAGFASRSLRRPPVLAANRVPTLLWTNAPPWLVITAICTASCVVWLPMSGLAGGLPAVGAGLGASQTELQWIADIFPLVLTALLLPAGTFLDRFGRRRGMLIGLIVLCGSLVWCAYANSPESMIAARFVSAVASALIFPATLASLTTTLPTKYQDRAVAIWAGTITIGAGLGLMGAVALIEVAWWGSMFVAMAVVTAIGVVLVAVVVPETKAAVHRRFDSVGAVLGVLGPGGLVLGLTEGPLHGWTQPMTLGSLVLGGVSLTGFIAWEFHCPHPLLDAHVFLNRKVLGSAVALIVIFTIDFALFFLLFQYRGYVFGEAPLKSAGLLMTVAIVFIPATLVGAPLAARYGMRLVCALAMTSCAGGLACLSLSDRDAPMSLFIAGLLLFWTGVGGFMTPATQGILNSLPAADQGVASAVNDIAREFGAALGIALFGSLYYAGYRSEVADLTNSVSSAELAESIHSSPGTGLADLAAGGGSLDQIHAVQDAVYAGWQLALWVGVGVLLGGMALICACLPKHVRTDSDLPAPVEELPPVREPESVLT